jgi:Protein of unknown function (DUF2950)
LEVPESPVVRVALESPVARVGLQPEQKLAVAGRLRRPPSRAEAAVALTVSAVINPQKAGAAEALSAEEAGHRPKRPAVAVAPAWAEAAAKAEAAAVEEAAVIKEEEEDADGDKWSTSNKTMKTKSGSMSSTKILVTVCAITAFGSALLAAPPKQDASAPEQVQKQFNTPKEAADALVQAAESFDVNALKEILGPGSTEILTSEDPVEDKNRAVAFAAKAREKTLVGTDAKNPNRAIVTVGNDDFPLPIPIVKQKGKWVFDLKSGRQEILNRRIGTNELDAIAICRGFVEAQNDYAQEKHDDAKVNQYAQRIVSTPSKHDGLAWQNPDGSWGGPVGEGIARAIEQGYSKQGQPFHGYYFKVLKGQGPAAPKGEMDFVVGGAMIGGFALAAAPAQYRVTGVKIFMVGPSGVVYEKDLGKDTLKIFEAMDRYNPDKTWKPTGDDWPEGQASAE